MISKHGLREILVATLTIGAAAAAAAWAAVAVAPAWTLLAAPLLILWAFILAFFRDPNRAIPAAPGMMVSPADGTVTEISQIDHDESVGGPALRIGIFLSVFNVHVNRSPCSGRVLRTDHRPGKFLDARDPQCGVLNESNTIVIQPDDDLGGPVIVRQIAGLIARRIICTLKPGDRVERGQRIGMIKFGSRTELIIPADAALDSAIAVGDSVKGASTVLLVPARQARSAAVRRPGIARQSIEATTP